MQAQSRPCFQSRPYAKLPCTRPIGISMPTLLHSHVYRRMRPGHIYIFCMSKHSLMYGISMPTFFDTSTQADAPIGHICFVGMMSKHSLAFPCPCTFCFFALPCRRMRQGYMRRQRSCSMYHMLGLMHLLKTVSTDAGMQLVQIVYTS